MRSFPCFFFFFFSYSKSRVVCYGTSTPAGRLATHLSNNQLCKQSVLSPRAHLYSYYYEISGLTKTPQLDSLSLSHLPPLSVSLCGHVSAVHWRTLGIFLCHTWWTYRRLDGNVGVGEKENKKEEAQRRRRWETPHCLDGPIPLSAVVLGLQKISVRPGKLFWLDLPGRRTGTPQSVSRSVGRLGPEQKERDRKFLVYGVTLTTICLRCSWDWPGNAIRPIIFSGSSARPSSSSAIQMQGQPGK